MGFYQAYRPSLKARALRLLTQREHSRSELQAKLTRHLQEGDDLSSLLDALEAKGFINAERVAESLVHQRAQLWGTQRLAQELRRKGLDDALIRTTCAQLAETEWERAQAVWQRRFGNAPPPDTLKEQARQMRFLAARGFAADIVRQIVATHARHRKVDA